MQQRSKENGYFHVRGTCKRHSWRKEPARFMNLKHFEHFDGSKLCDILIGIRVRIAISVLLEGSIQLPSILSLMVNTVDWGEEWQ